MSRKGALLGIGIVLLLSGLGALLVALYWHEPDVFQRCAIPPGEERKKHSGEFQSDLYYLYDNISAEREFYAHFTDLRINSYFEEDFVRSGVAARVLPENISQPRIAIEPDKIRLAFRYGTGLWSTIVSIDVRVWLAAKERNVVALELQSLHAGSLPISAQSLLEQVSEAARQQNIEVTWYRHEGNPVALLRFQADRPHPTVMLQQLELRQGELLIRGRAAEATSLQAMLPLAEISPKAN
jgi:hypothetical protein